MTNVYSKIPKVSEDTRRTRAQHQQTILDQIKYCGANWYDLRLPETHILADIIDPQENILAIVYGRYKLTEQLDRQQVGRGVLIATDRRVLLLDKKPLFIHCKEFAYSLISGMSYGHVWPSSTMSLSTRSGDIQIQTYNQDCIRKFIAVIEPYIFAHES